MKTRTLTLAMLLVCGLVAGTVAARAMDPSTSSALLPGGGSVVAVADNPITPATGVATVATQEGTAVASDEASDEGFRFFRSSWLKSRRITIGGWIDQGFTWNSDSPSNKFNGPISFNDRSNEYQLNQLYLFAERVTKTDGRGFDLGGHVDVLYGTDYRFVQGLGVESNWIQDERFYGLAMPQAYGDVAINDLVIRAGRFYAPVGYESEMSPQNFFYSHSYTFQYAEPSTLTGVEGIYKLNDRLSVFAGGHQGWDVVTDSEAHLGMLMGFNWNINENNELAWTLVLGNQPIDGVNCYRTLSSFVVTHKFSDRFRYVFQGDVGREEDSVAAYDLHAAADWYGLVHYLVYDLTPCWSLGLRYEYFVDKNGARVYSLSYPHRIFLPPSPADWQEVSLGVNYKPNHNVLVRSELRWDVWDPRVDINGGPFNDYQSRRQFLWGTDLIVKF